MQFRLITYNIHKGIGGIDRRYRPERVIAALSHYRPDIVLLQEVVDGAARTRHDQQADLIGEALDLHHRAFQPNVRLKRGVYGNAILSRFPLDDVHDLELTVGRKKRRRAQLARIRVRDAADHSHSLLVVNCHLGLAASERRIQLRRILDTDFLRHAHHNTAAIAAGDMNDVWGGLGRGFLVPAGFTSASGHTRTFPAFLPLRSLDRIFYRGDIRLHTAHASRTAIAREASDHLPLVAEFELVKATS